MKSKLFTRYHETERKQLLASIIDIENMDDLKIHFKVWTHEQGRSEATGIFYPIITGQWKFKATGY